MLSLVMVVVFPACCVPAAAAAAAAAAVVDLRFLPSLLPPPRKLMYWFHSTAFVNFVAGIPRAGCGLWRASGRAVAVGVDDGEVMAASLPHAKKEQ
jgi:hypothetical protein